METGMSEWQPTATMPTDETILVVVEPTPRNELYLGRAKTVAVYVDEDGRICCPGTWEPDLSFVSGYWQVTSWMPFPEPPKAPTT
jgi:hypothetical protein